jgi:RND family efflux transporter MFP subunit
MKPEHRRWILIPALLAVPVAIVIGLAFLRTAPQKKEAENLDLLVETQTLEKRPERFLIQSQGTVRPRTQTALSAEVSGSIVSISPKFVAGGVFARDEVLMRIDPTNYTVAVEQSDALVLQRQIEFDGAEKLRTKGYRAESEYASAAAALATAKADLVRAQRNLERTYIRLPYEGMVLGKDADLGQFVNPGSALGVTFATDVAEVRLALTDQDLAFVALPDAAAIAGSGSAKGPHVRLSAVQKGRRVEWDAQVVRSEGVVDERSRVTYAVARIDDPYRLHSDGAPLPIGTFVSASIVAPDTVDVIRVPRGAIRGADELIFVDDDNRLEIRSVDILRTDAKYAYLQSGAEDGERISITSIEAPSNGMMVRTSNDVGNETADKSNAGAQLASGAEAD